MKGVIVKLLLCVTVGMGHRQWGNENRREFGRFSLRLG